MRLKRQIFSFIFLFFAAFFSYAQTDATTEPVQAAAPADAQVANTFPPTLSLNSQNWKLDNFQANKDVMLGEYVLDSENVKNWTQLVTIQKFNFPINNELTPAKFADLEMEELKKQNYDITFNTITSSNTEVLIEFRVKTPVEAQQDEIQRIIITPNRKLIVLHYVIKKEDMGAEARTAWTKILQTFNLDFLPKD